MSIAATLPVKADAELHAAGVSLGAQLDPRAWVLGFLSSAIWISTSLSLIPLLIFAVALLLLLAVRRDRTHGMQMRLRTMILWVSSASLLTIVLYTVFGPSMDGDAVQVSGVHIQYDALSLGLIMAAKLSALLFLSGVLLSFVAPLTLATGITGLCLPSRHLGVPVANFFYLAFFLTRMIPRLIQELGILRLAQRSRGIAVSKWRSYHALALPMFASALRRSDSTALVLASRGFDSHRIPASVQALRYRKLDYVALVTIVAGWGVWLYLSLK